MRDLFGEAFRVVPDAIVGARTLSKWTLEIGVALDPHGSLDFDDRLAIRRAARASRRLDPSPDHDDPEARLPFVKIPRAVPVKVAFWRADGRERERAGSEENHVCEQVFHSAPSWLRNGRSDSRMRADWTDRKGVNSSNRGCSSYKAARQTNGPAAFGTSALAGRELHITRQFADDSASRPCRVLGDS